MKKYQLRYLLYVLEHKKNFFKTAWKRKLYIAAFTHDISKLKHDEFFPYAEWFYGDYGIKLTNKERTMEENEKHEEVREAFLHAWNLHSARNEHHCEYWVDESGHPLPMPKNRILEMISDWEAMSIKFGGSIQSYYLENYFKFNFHEDTRLRVDKLLNVTPVSDRSLYEFLNEEIWCEEFLFNYIENLERVHDITLEDFKEMVLNVRT